MITYNEVKAITKQIIIDSYSSYFCIDQTTNSIELLPTIYYNSENTLSDIIKFIPHYPVILHKDNVLMWNDPNKVKYNYYYATLTEQNYKNALCNYLDELTVKIDNVLNVYEKQVIDNLIDEVLNI